MATGPRYTVPYKRKKEEKTNYRKRLELLKSGKSRLVVRKSNKRVIAQIVNFTPKGDNTIVSVSNNDLKKYGYNIESNNLPSSYLTGYLIGKLALKNKVKEAVLDTGLEIMSKGNKLYAVLMGAVEAGLKINHNSEVLPSKERIEGQHIKGFKSEILSEVKKNIDKVGQ